MPHLTMIEAGRTSSPDHFHWNREEILGLNDRSVAFKASNASTEAEAGRTQWYLNYNNSQTFIVMLCSDARERIAFPPSNVIDISTIAASGPTEPYAQMLNDPRPKGVVTANHYSGAQFNPTDPGVPLIGCGGLGARAHVESGKNDKRSKKGILRYVAANIHDKDAAYNAVKNGALAATLTKRPVLAGVHDHVYGAFTPLAYFMNMGTSELSETVIPQADLYNPERYNPYDLYKNGLPSLDESRLPDVFKQFLENQRIYLRELQELHPDLHESMQTQNPDYLFITTEKVPTRLRYPQLLQQPGSFFQIHIPRAKLDLGVHIEQEAINTALEQAEYPIDVAKFTNLHTIVIETGSIVQSRIIAESLMSARRHKEDEDGNEIDTEPWILDWLQRNPHSQILLGQTNSGTTTRIELFNPQLEKTI